MSCGGIAWGFMDCTRILGLQEDCMDFISILLRFDLLTQEPSGVPPLFTVTVFKRDVAMHTVVQSVHTRDFF